MESGERAKVSFRGMRNFLAKQVDKSYLTKGRVMRENGNCNRRGSYLFSYRSIEDMERLEPFKNMIWKDYDSIIRIDKTAK